MKKILLSFGIFLLAGCSYSLKTSLITDTPERNTSQSNISFEDCNGSEYCLLKAMADIETFSDLEDALMYVSQDKEDLLWDTYLRTRVNYNAVIQEDCGMLKNTELQQRCDYAVRFNQGELINCHDEVSTDSCVEQKMYSSPSIGLCNQKEGEERLACVMAMSLMANKSSYCEVLGEEQQSRCRSFVSNSLYFCEDKACVDHYFMRNMIRNPRLTYCRFQDEELQGYCEKKIKDWFALSHNNFLYCSTKDCYRFLVEKRVYDRPDIELVSLQKQSCDHLTVARSNDRCQHFVADVFARIRADIGSCRSFSCFETFKENLDFVDEQDCSVFESQLLEGEDVFGQSQELSMCLSVIDYNRALLLRDDTLCRDASCLEEVSKQKEVSSDLSEEVDLTKVLDPSRSAEDIKKELEQVDVNEALEDVDLNKAVEGIDMNTLRDSIDPSGALDGVDLNEEVKKVDLNEEVKKIDFKALLEQIDLEKVLQNKGE